MRFKILLVSVLLCGCQAVKIEPSREVVRAGNSKQNFITGIKLMFNDKKIIFKGAPYKDPNHQEIIRQEYLTSIKF